MEYCIHVTDLVKMSMYIYFLDSHVGYCLKANDHPDSMLCSRSLVYFRDSHLTVGLHIQAPLLAIQ